MDTIETRPRTEATLLHELPLRLHHNAYVVKDHEANRRFVEIETEGDDGTFADAIELLGCVCSVTGGKIRTVLPEGIEIRDIYRLAADRDIQLRRMNYRRDSLEDIFLNAMEQTGAPDGRL